MRRRHHLLSLLLIAFMASPTLLTAEGIPSPSDALCAKISASLGGRACRMTNLTMEGRQLAADRVELGNGPDFSQGTAWTFNDVRLSLDWNSLVALAGGGMLSSDASSSAGELTAQSYKADTVQAQSLKLQWDLKGLGKDPAALSGTAAASQGATKVTLSSSVSDERLQQLGMKGASTLALDRVDAAATANKGVITVSTIKGRGGDGSLTGHGTVQLVQELINLTAKIKRPAVPGRGEINADLRITGPLKQPNVAVKSLRQSNVRMTLPSDSLK